MRIGNGAIGSCRSGFVLDVRAVLVCVFIPDRPHLIGDDHDDHACRDGEDLVAASGKTEKEEYGDPKRFARELAKNPCIESVDICNGEWELVAKVFVKDKTEFYNLITNYISKKGVGKIISLVSYKQLKTGFVQV